MLERAEQYAQSIRACYRCFGSVEHGAYYDQDRYDPETFRAYPTVTCTEPACGWSIAIWEEKQPRGGGRQLAHTVLHDPRAGDKGRG